jgi:DNA recombination protein RmuC
MDFITVTISCVLLLLVISIIVMIRLTIQIGQNRGNKSQEEQIERLKTDLLREINNARLETIQSVLTNMRDLEQLMVSFQKETTEVQDKRLIGLTDQMKAFSMQSEQKLEQIRATMESRISAMQEDNSKKLELMRATVDEKMQKTLEDRISQSFKMVSERLEQVYKGLGEMQSLAVGVGDLKKVLSNVKTRGILGEIQLGAILEEILSQEQYESNIATKKGSAERVEYAVKLPGDANGVVYLPIDAKFPADGYTKLIEAYDTGDQILIAAASESRRCRIFQTLF